MFTESVLVMGNRGPYNRVAARVRIPPGGGVALMRRLRVHEPIAALEEHNGAALLGIHRLQAAGCNENLRSGSLAVVVSTTPRTLERGAPQCMDGPEARARGDQGARGLQG